MRNWFVYMTMMLFFASCSEQQIMEEMASSTKLTEPKTLTVSPQDLVMSLLYQARWGDGSAYLKLADCYRDGISVKQHIICDKRKATNERRITITDRHKII